MTDGAEARIAAEEAVLRAFVAKRARTLARFEDVDDLVQSILLRAIDGAQSKRFEDAEHLRAWLFTIATNHLADRREHWRSLKRGAAHVARLTLSGASGEGVPLPRSADTGPMTRAERRELLVLSSRALGALPERDQDLVRWRSEGVSLDEQARRLGVSYEAAQRAGLRAFERFRKVFELASRR